MSNLNTHPVRRTAAGVLAGALAFSGAFAAGSPAFAATGFALDRLAGDDRYETSAAIAAQFGAADGAILASGENRHIVDALSASFLAGVRQDPVLLTASGQVSAQVLAQLNALTSKNVTIVGGEMAVSAAVEAQLRTAGFTVTRLAGDDRYETSEAIIRAGVAEGDESKTGILVSGQSPVDALAAGALAYKGKHPVFLTAGGTVPQDTLDAMQAAGTTSVIIIGGTTVVPESVRAQLTALNISVVTRLGGVDRSETSRLVADYLIQNAGFSATTFNVASGANNGVDALSGAALSGKTNTVLLVTNTSTNVGSVDDFATARSATLTTTGRIFGGTSVVPEAVETALETAGGAGASFQTLNVMPNTAATLQLADEAGTATVANADNRTYTVTGLDDATTYRITLINATSIGGTATAPTFLSSAIEPATTPATFAVATGADIADIVAVGGTSPEIGNTGGTNTFNTATVRPVNGSITFTIDGTATGTVVPAVYVNGAAGGTATTGGVNPRLETSATAAGAFAAVTESFGLGGPTTFVNPAAVSQNIDTARGVDTVSKATNQFDAAGFTFTYDANDTFRVGGLPATLEEFEAALSREDTFTGTYTSNPTLSSSLNLTDVGPTAPAAIDPTAGTDASSNDITVTVPVTDAVDTVVIQRATVTGGTDELTDGEAGTYATVATLTPAAGATSVTYVDENLAAGMYRYRAAVVSDGQQSEFSATGANEQATAPAADTRSPQASVTTRTTDSGFAGLLDAGDVFTVRTDEALAAPAAGSAILIRDANDTVVQLTCGTNATCSLNTVAVPTSPAGPNAGAAVGTVLTVTVTAAPTVVEPGTVAGLQYTDATITNTAGINDVAGNRFNATAGDRVIDVDTTAPGVTAGAVAAGAQTVTFTANEALNAGSVAVGDFAETSAAAITGVALGSDGRTITVTFGAALAANETVTLNAGQVADVSANVGPASNVTATVTV